MTFLLDTNVISELRRPRRAAESVVNWVSTQAGSSLWCSVVTILELEIGTLRALRQDKPKGTILQTWIDEQVLRRFADRIVPINTTVALKCATLHVPNPRSDRDAYIAATALVHDMTVVTRNVRDFEATGVKLLNPWTDKG
jgi:predicted nucleic acid-binding protein